jgi:cytoskeletal protein CcmA (bactofilin family)
MIIDNGNVGINTTTPSEKLQISGNTIVSGTISGGTMVITTQPTSGYTATQILMRNSTTGQVEITDSTSPSIYNYGMTYAMSTFNYLT